MSDLNPTSVPVSLPAANVALPRAGRSWIWLVGALALTGLHFLWIGAHLAPAIMSPDANGYVVQARLIAEEGSTSFATASPAQYVGMHWLEAAPGVFQSRYPAGLPLLFAAAWKVGGLTAALWINPLLASGTVLLVFFLARRFGPEVFALLAAAVVATVPVTNQHALDADAHVAAAFFLVGGVLALLRFGETRAPFIGLVAGALLGALPTIRYPEAVVGVAIGAWLLWRVRPSWRVWPAVLGALVPIGALCLHNTAAYGAFWRTGYALTHEQTGFGFGYLVSHAIPYLQALGGQGMALMFAFGAAGLAALAGDARRRDEGLLFAGIVVPLVLLYMAYYFGGGGPGGAGGSLRFLIPTFPFIAVAGVWLLARVAEHLGAAGRAAVLVIAVLQLMVSLAGSVQTLASTKTTLAAAARTRAVAKNEIPAGSVVIVEHQLAESLDAAGQWKLVEENLVAGSSGPGLLPGAMRGGAGRGGMFPPMPGGPGGPEGREAGLGDDAPSPMQRSKNRAQQERYAGLRPDERRARVWADVKTWAGDKPVFWIARSLESVDNALPDGAKYRSVAEVEAPTMMMGPGGGGGPMPGMMGRGGMAGPGRGLAIPGGAGRGFTPSGDGGGPMLAGGRGGLPGAANAKLRVVRIEWAKR